MPSNSMGKTVVAIPARKELKKMTPTSSSVPIPFILGFKIRHIKRPFKRRRAKDKRPRIRDPKPTIKSIINKLFVHLLSYYNWSKTANNKIKRIIINRVVLKINFLATVFS